MGYSHGTKWTEQKIKEEINYLVQKHDLNTFPTQTEMIKFSGNRSLASAVSKYGGTRYFAARMNLPLKQCESEFGNAYELKAIEDIFDKTGMIAKQTRPKYPYDLLVDNNIKVDVKVSRPVSNGKGTLINTFNLEKTDPTCDLFVFYCLKQSGEIHKTLVVPACVVSGQTQVVVGMSSKWDSFKDRWDYFNKFSEFNGFILQTFYIPKQRKSKEVDWS